MCQQLLPSESVSPQLFAYEIPTETEVFCHECKKQQHREKALAKQVSAAVAVSHMFPLLLLFLFCYSSDYFLVFTSCSVLKVLSFSFFTAMPSFSFAHSSHTQAFQRDLSEKYIVIVPNFQYCPKVTCRRTKLPLDACTNPHSCVDYMSEQRTVCLKICLMMALIMACLPS